MGNNSFNEYEFSEEIANALKSLGYNIPTEVQQKVIPLVLDKQDLIVRSQTGSGKTAAYGIPICESITWLENKPQALILVPTRELAVQVKEDITNFGRLKRIKATAVYGRQPISIQISELKQKTHVIVGTPGRIIDHLERGTLNLNQISYLVIDEADEMLRMGFIEQVEEIIKELPRIRMTMLFSATMPDKVKSLAMRHMKNPLNIEVESTGISVDKIDHFMYKIDEDEKFALLTAVTVIENPDSCIIFCNTKDQVDQVFVRLVNLGYRCRKIHGGMEQKDRLEALEDFRRGVFRYFVATDVAARGIDIENVTLVINYDLPLEKEAYVHRTGRTGRAGLKGKAISFANKRELRLIAEIETFIGFEITCIAVPDNEMVAEYKAAFEVKKELAPVLKKAKGAKMDKQIMKLRFNAGKNKKLRATNFVGVISNIEGINADDIGIISVLDSLTFIEILNGKGNIVLEAMKTTPIGGRLLKVSDTGKHK
ncbi:MAG TPA: DEAD/DEAH box helicase [Mobilitalea sp.]|nr:DEAD/DEAH box helicase [Mobilitalea sp.]